MWITRYLQNDLETYKNGMKNHISPLDSTLVELYGSIHMAEMNDQTIPHEYAEYAHMIATAVTAGETVTAGQVIGYVSSTGNHLHIVVTLGIFHVFVQLALSVNFLLRVIQF